MSQRANELGVEERAGVGFSGLENTDIDNLFSTATAGEANDDEDRDSATILGGESSRPAPSTPVVPQEAPVAASASAASAADTEHAQVTPERTDGAEGQHEHAEEGESAQEMYSAPVPAEEAQAPVSESAAQSEGEVIAPVNFGVTKNVKVDANSEMVQRVIRTLDTYRSLGGDARSVASQFICNDADADPEDEVSIVVSALSSNDDKSAAMFNLVNAYEQSERHERLFYLLQISPKELGALGSLIELIVDVEDFTRNDRIRFAKEVESYIDELSSDVVDFVSSTQSVLEAAGATRR